MSRMATFRKNFMHFAHNVRVRLGFLGVAGSGVGQAFTIYGRGPSPDEPLTGGLSRSWQPSLIDRCVRRRRRRHDPSDGHAWAHAGTLAKINTELTHRHSRCFDHAAATAGGQDFWRPGSGKRTAAGGCYCVCACGDSLDLAQGRFCEGTALSRFNGAD
jgi:hypothetical protein